MKPILRIASGTTLIAFALGGGLAVWEALRRDFVLEFQAGAASNWIDRVLAVAQSASIEALGFGATALLLGVLALLVTRRRSEDGSGERLFANFALMAGALGGWLSVIWVANDALPFLSDPDIALLNVTGFTLVLACLAIFRFVVGLLPWSPKDSPTALTLACLLLVIPAEITAQVLLLADRSLPNVALVGAGLLLTAPLAGLLARALRPAVHSLGRRAAEGPLVAPRLGLSGGLLLILCVVASAPDFQLSSVPADLDYAAVERSDEAPAGPNVVLVTIDTLRADHLGAYGYERDTSPFLDSLAQGGTLFADPSASAAWTKPATGTILTGLYPSRHGALYHGSSLRLPDGEQTLAEAFQERGYVTAGFVTNPNIKAVFDFDRGFDLYFDSPVEDTLTRSCIRSSIFGKTLMMLTRHQFNWKYENDVLQMNRHIESWLAKNTERPFFLYLHYIDPHVPYAPPGQFRDEFVQDHGAVFFNERKRLVGTDLYDGEIRYTDDGMRLLVDRMKELGVWENTMFVVTSDHGEELFEHGVLGHGFSLYQPVLQVPLIFHGAGVPAGRVVDAPVQILDLAATLLDASGEDRRTFGDGHSFAGALDDPDWRPATEYFLENEFGQDDSNHREFVLTGIRSGQWKLVLTEQNAFFPPQHPDYGREALFDLEADPEEQENLIAAEEHRDLIEGLLERLQSHSEYLYETGFRDVKPSALSPDIEASLKALGY